MDCSFGFRAKAGADTGMFQNDSKLWLPWSTPFGSELGDTVRVRTKASSPSGVVERSVRKRREGKGE